MYLRDWWELNHTFVIFATYQIKVSNVSTEINCELTAKIDTCKGKNLPIADWLKAEYEGCEIWQVIHLT